MIVLILHPLKFRSIYFLCETLSSTTPLLTTWWVTAYTHTHMRGLRHAAADEKLKACSTFYAYNPLLVSSSRFNDAACWPHFIPLLRHKRVWTQVSRHWRKKRTLGRVRRGVTHTKHQRRDSVISSTHPVFHMWPANMICTVFYSLKINRLMLKRLS